PLGLLVRPALLAPRAPLARKVCPVKTAQPAPLGLLVRPVLLAQPALLAPRAPLALKALRALSVLRARPAPLAPLAPLARKALLVRPVLRARPAPLAPLAPLGPPVAPPKRPCSVSASTKPTRSLHGPRHSILCALGLAVAAGQVVLARQAPTGVVVQAARPVDYLSDSSPSPISHQAKPRCG
ncbi:MAG TPA: hypothetical protein PL091_11045, partial [Actinomycetota bacterium]|nr:hypothetical protein [Actinomycetota bacterium]